MDVVSKSDPQCQVFLMDRQKNTWTKIGETEVLKYFFHFCVSSSFTQLTLKFLILQQETRSILFGLEQSKLIITFQSHRDSSNETQTTRCFTFRFFVFSCLFTCF